MKNWKTTLLGWSDIILAVIFGLWLYFDWPNLKVVFAVLGVLKLLLDGYAKILSKDHDVDNNEDVKASGDPLPPGTPSGPIKP